MRVKKLLVMALIALPTMVMAQSTYEPVGSSDNKTPLDSKPCLPAVVEPVCRGRTQD